MSRTMKEIIKEEFLTCNICTDQFQNPKILKCLHTFCETCILSTIQYQRLNSASDVISCPVCRTRIETNSSGEPKLQTNYPVKNLLELIQVSPNNESFTELYRVQAGLNLDRAHVIAIAEKSQCGYLETSVYELQAAVSDLRRELTQEKSSCRFLERNIGELETTVTELRRELTEERRRSGYLQTSNMTLQAGASDLGRQLGEEKKRRSDLQTGNNALRDDITNLRRQEVEYKKKLNNEKHETAKLREQLAENDQIIDHLLKVVDDIRDQYSVLKVQNDKMTNWSISTWMTNQYNKYLKGTLWNMFQMSVSWLPKLFQKKREERKHQ